MIQPAVITLVSAQVSAIADGTNVRAFYSGLQNYEDVRFLINVTAAGTATGTVTLFIQDSWNNGTTWDDLVSSAAITLGTTTGTQRYWIQGRIAPAVHTTTTSTLSTQGSAVSNLALAASSARVGPFGDRIQVVEKVASASGTPAGCTYSIHMLLGRGEND